MTVKELVKTCKKGADFRIVGEAGHDFDELLDEKYALPIFEGEVHSWYFDENGILIIELRYMIDDDIPF